MANYNDLNIKQKALLLRHLQKAGLLQGIEPGNMLPTVAEMYNKFSVGGDTKDNEEHRDSVNSDDSVVRRFNGADITYNDYQRMQADLIRKKAVDIALSRTSGVAPHDANGNPLASCIFTFGDSYRQAGEYPDVQAWSNYKFNLDPSAYGFVANGPVENTIEGDMYQFMTPEGTPTHATMITGYRGDTPLITESQGHAERPFASPLLSRAEFVAQRANGNPFGVDTSGTYEEYVNAYNKQKAAWENEYKKNVGVLTGGEGMYETYRYIGTPRMRSDWKSQYDTLPRTITGIQPLPTIVDKARTNNMFAEGGPAEKRIPNDPEQYRQEQRDAVIANSLNNSNNRTLPAVPILSKNSQMIPAATKRATDNNIVYNYSRMPDYDYSKEEYEAALGRLAANDYKDTIEDRLGHSCIYTATDNYGNKYRVSGNETFLKNTKNGTSGFKLISEDELKPGDIVQGTNWYGIPVHALTFVGHDNSGNDIYNYSNGGSGDRAIKKNNKYQFPIDGTTPLYYRFIGTPDDNERWTKDWMQKHKTQLQLKPLEPIVDRARPLNSFAEGGNLFRRGGRNNTVLENTLLKDYNNI